MLLNPRCCLQFLYSVNGLATPMIPLRSTKSYE